MTWVHRCSQNLYVVGRGLLERPTHSTDDSKTKEKATIFIVFLRMLCLNRNTQRFVTKCCWEQN